MQPPRNGLRPVPGGPSILTVFREKLGLEFKAEKGPVEVPIVERAEKPSASRGWVSREGRACNHHPFQSALFSSSSCSIVLFFVGSFQTILTSNFSGWYLME
jgi:hypothetical protein